MTPTEFRTARKALGLDAAQELLERHGYKVVPPNLADALGVSGAAIRFVRTGVTWRHVE